VGHELLEFPIGENELMERNYEILIRRLLRHDVDYFKMTWANNNKKRVINARKVPGFNFGLMKTGTSSLWKTLETIPELNDTKVSHYRCTATSEYQRLPKSVTDLKPGCSKHTCGQFVNVAVSLKRKPLDFFAELMQAQPDCLSIESGVAGLPQIKYLDEFVSAYKPDEAVFVLTTRSTEDWVNSILNWPSAKMRFVLAFRGLTIDGHTFILPRNLDEERALLADVKDWHENRTRTKLRAVGHELLEFPIGENELMERNYEILIRRLLGHEVDNFEMKWANKNKNLQLRRNEKKKRNSRKILL